MFSIVMNMKAAIEKKIDYMLKAGIYVDMSSEKDCSGGKELWDGMVYASKKNIQGV